MSSLLVAPTTITCARDSTPSISFKSWQSARSETDVSSSPRYVAIASISSKKTILGELSLAFLKISRIAFSVSPTYLLNNSGPFTAMKFRPLSVARALAIIVFEHPGGPYNKIPCGGLMPTAWNFSGNFKGHSTHWRTLNLICSLPPISDQSVLGTSTSKS